MYAAHIILSDYTVSGRGGIEIANYLKMCSNNNKSSEMVDSPSYLKSVKQVNKTVFCVLEKKVKCWCVLKHCSDRKSHSFTFSCNNAT